MDIDPREDDVTGPSFEKKWITRKLDVHKIVKFLRVGASIFLYGHSGVGKTTLIKDLMIFSGFNHLYLNCKEHYSEKLVTKCLLTGIRKLYGVQEDQGTVTRMCDVVEVFNALSVEETEEKPALTIVLDCCDRLVRIKNLLARILLVSKLVQKIKINFIMINEILLDDLFKSSDKFGYTSIVPIQLWPYSEAALQQILQEELSHKLTGYKLQVFPYFFKLIYQSFSRFNITNVREFKYLITVLFPHFIAPIENATKKAAAQKLADDPAKLFSRDFKRTLRAISANLFHHSVNENDIESLKQQDVFDSKDSLLSADNTCEDVTYLAEKCEAKFTVNTIHFLIACYLASYNPVGYDKKLFKKPEKKARKNTRPKGNEQLILGPKKTPMTRVLAIYDSVMSLQMPDNDENILEYHSINFFALTLNKLEDYGLIARQSSNLEPLVDIKLVCHASHDYIEKICEDIKFPLADFLLRECK